MAALTFGSYSQARDHLKDVLDAAANGQPVILHRERTAAAVVDAERLVHYLGRLCPKATVVKEAGGWSVFLVGVPVAADGATFDDAIDEMADALREYADDWQDHLGRAPNHQNNWPLVQLVGLSSDAQLREWLVGASQ
jgi:predicted RNase H-like HicB family nuclease